MSDLDKKRWIMQVIQNWRMGRSDGYHDAVEERPDGTLALSIQTYDSPMGDCWWYPVVRLLNGCIDVEIVSETHERR